MEISQTSLLIIQVVVYILTLVHQGQSRPPFVLKRLSRPQNRGDTSYPPLKRQGNGWRSRSPSVIKYKVSIQLTDYYYYYLQRQKLQRRDGEVLTTGWSSLSGWSGTEWREPSTRGIIAWKILTGILILQHYEARNGWITECFHLWAILLTCHCILCLNSVAS